MDHGELRPLTSGEEALLRYMLSPQIAGVEVLRGQIEGLQAYRDCECGCPSITLVVAESTASPIGDPFATFGAADVERSVILFVRGGRLTALECGYYEDARDEWPPLADLSESQLT